MGPMASAAKLKLRSRRERPRCRRAAEQRDELAPLHVWWRSPSCANYTIVQYSMKEDARDFSGNLLKTAKLKGSINSTPLTFRSHPVG